MRTVWVILINYSAKRFVRATSRGPCSIAILISRVKLPEDNLGEHAKAQFREGHDFEEVKLSLVNKYLNEHLIHHFKSEARPLKGDRRAPVKLVKFADFQCSHCARLARLLNTVMEKLGDIASLEYRHFPLSRHSYAHYAAAHHSPLKNRASFGKCMIFYSKINRLFRWSGLMNWLEASVLIGHNFT